MIDRYVLGVTTGQIIVNFDNWHQPVIGGEKALELLMYFSPFNFVVRFDQEKFREVYC